MGKITNKVLYNRRTWLNKEDSPSTGNVCSFVYKDEEDVITAYLSIADCYNSARLHKLSEDTMESFIDKMKVLNNEITLFIKYLEKSK